MKRLALAFALAQLMLLLVAAYGAPRVSEQQAQSIAAKFAAAVGMTWGTPTRVELHRDVNAQRKQELRLDFGDRASIGLDPVRGVVTSAVDYRTVTAINAAPAPAKLDQAAALARAKAIVKAAGLDGVLPVESPTTVLRENSPGVFSYYVLWRPMYHRLPYDSTALAVNISPVNGRLITLSTGLDVVPPRATKVSVSKAAAITSATAWARRFDAAFHPSTTKAEVRIVTANSYWTHYGLGRKLRPDSRVAWVVDIAGNGRELIFWIDAANRDLLGGTQSSGRSGPA